MRRKHRIVAGFMLFVILIPNLSLLSATGPRVPLLLRESGPFKGQVDGVPESRMRELVERIRKASPSEAAMILKELSRQRGVQVASIPSMSNSPDTTIHLPGTVLNPPEGVEPSLDLIISVLLNEIPPEDYEEGLRDELLGHFPEGKIPIIAQFKHRLSLEEIIELYELGVKDLVEPLNEITYIIYIPIENFRSLANFPARRWLGEYKPEFKINVSFKGINRAIVEPIDFARVQYERDLTNLGTQILQHYEAQNSYYTAMSPFSANEASRLWS